MLSVSKKRTREKKKSYGQFVAACVLEPNLESLKVFPLNLILKWYFRVYRGTLTDTQRYCSSALFLRVVIFRKSIASLALFVYSIFDIFRIFDLNVRASILPCRWKPKQNLKPLKRVS